MKHINRDGTINDSYEHSNVFEDSDIEDYRTEPVKKGGKLNLLRFGFVALFLLFVFLGLVYSVRNLKIQLW